MPPPVERHLLVKRSRLRRTDAAALAIKGLGFLAEDAERLDRFLVLSGLDMANLREAASQPSFLPAILDYFAADEPLLLAFATWAEQDPEIIAKAREILSPPPETPGSYG